MGPPGSPIKATEALPLTGDTLGRALAGPYGVKTGGGGESLEAGVDGVPREIEGAGVNSLEREIGCSEAFGRGRYMGA